MSTQQEEEQLCGHVEFKILWTHVRIPAVPYCLSPLLLRHHVPGGLLASCCQGDHICRHGLVKDKIFASSNERNERVHTRPPAASSPPLLPTPFRAPFPACQTHHAHTPVGSEGRSPREHQGTNTRRRLSNS
ncbi:hypothetical protein E2C01_063242 [Portunus trituberculatus]|uniref:Uncharacterized protein n=1 Tax=Portunus trituberculatus TaxID=210409 RepID=A0A5B7HH21_PORTR|nr:hypothetical protein [Portunus trituberculatus]